MVAAVIKARNENDEPIIFQRNEDMVNLKIDGNFIYPWTVFGVKL